MARRWGRSIAGADTSRLEGMCSSCSAAPSSCRADGTVRCQKAESASPQLARRMRRRSLPPLPSPMAPSQPAVEIDSLQEKCPFVFENAFPRCLSRACLGKMIPFSYSYIHLYKKSKEKDRLGYLLNRSSASPVGLPARIACFLSAFPYACPEPVLVKRSRLV